MNGHGIVSLAEGVSGNVIDKMAHALGWPDRLNIVAKGGQHRVKWRNPYRNGWAGDPLDPEWAIAVNLGLAVAHGRVPYSTHAGFSVTPLGMAVTKIRLMAEAEAARLEAE